MIASALMAREVGEKGETRSADCERLALCRYRVVVELDVECSRHRFGWDEGGIYKSTTRSLLKNIQERTIDGIAAK